jgi:V/A-type H+-transporting ATPase subunit C
MNFLISKGWGYGYNYDNYELVLEEELEKGWNFILELSKEKEPFAVFLCQNDYENLKMCIKSIAANLKEELIYSPRGLLLPEEIYNIVKNNEIEKLPNYMQNSAREATKVLLQTEDGQLCDIILDKDMLKTMNSFAEQSDCDLIKYYSSTIIDCANIKIIVQAVKAGKNAEFLKRACSEYGKISVSELIKSGIKGINEFCKYLTFTEYSGCVGPLSESMRSFEKWRDDRIAMRAKEERKDLFSIGPLVAYVLTKMNEIRTARIIISGKINNISEEVLRERVRMTYA